jgi:nucleoside-diphosphate-sugar epimerase
VRVLVTGASGFIGTALVRRLMAGGIEVRGTWWRDPEPTIAQVEWRRLSQIDSAAAWRDVASGCEVVIHLAALAHQTGTAGTGRWPEFWRVNVEATRVLAQASMVAGVRRLIFVSSVAALCTRSEECLDENSPCMPEEDYGRSKLEAERALRLELEGSVVDWCILRPPLVYGPGNPGNMARLLQLIGTGLPLPFGAITNRRSFMFVDNLVDAILTVVRYPAAIRSTYMVSDGSDFATPELVSALAAASGRTVRLIRVPIGLLKLVGRLGDLAARFLRIDSGVDSYSVGRLVGSLPVDSCRFRGFFSWHPPVDAKLALMRTCSALRQDASES